MDKQKNNNSLADAPQAVHLAVDLIQLLEENKIDNQLAVDALEIVLQDFKNKQIAAK
ncbi:YbaM family protein [Psychromonas sp.]|uniref:YbaM family protein n=1 Tax=Psychromonas sp. TaxID=1884585 RepID=UPI003561A23C